MINRKGAVPAPRNMTFLFFVDLIRKPRRRFGNFGEKFFEASPYDLALSNMKTPGYLINLLLNPLIKTYA